MIYEVKDAEGVVVGTFEVAEEITAGPYTVTLQEDPKGGGGPGWPTTP